MWPAFKNFLKSNRNVFFLIFVLGFAIYANSLRNEMFWDDQDNILFNEYIKNWQHFPKYFSENNVAGRGLVSNYWRPLPLTIWSIEWHLWQDWAPGYHFVQIALHISAAFLLFILLKKLFNNLVLGLLTSILFLVHPLQTEAITYVSGISDPLSAILIFSSLIFYVNFRESSSKIPLTLSLITYSLSFLARETSVFFLGYFALAEFILHKKIHKTIKFSRLFLDLVHNLWPYVVCSVFYILLRLSVLNFQNTLNLYDEQNEFTSNPNYRFLTFLRIITIYGQLLFWPHDLHMERSVELAKSLKSPDVLFGLSVLISFISALIYFLKKNLLIVFSIAWILIGLFPTSNILVPINGLLFEHWLYLPMIGVWLLLLWSGLKLAHKNKVLKILLVSCYALLVAFFSIRTVQQNRLWRNPITFYNYTLKFAPTSYRVLNNLGMAYASVNNHENAIRIYQLTIRQTPSNAVAYHNLGNSHKAVGDKQKAIESFEKAISLQADFFFSYNALADLYVKEKDYKKAIDVLNRLHKQQPSQQLPQLIKQLETQYSNKLRVTDSE